MNKITLHIAIILFSAGIMLAGSSFSGNRLEQAVINYVNQSSQTEAKISILNQIKDFSFKQNNITAEIENTEELRGLTHIFIIFRDDIREIRRVKIPLRIRLFKNVLTYAKPLKSGSIIQINDLTYSYKEVTDFRQNEIPEKQTLIGKYLNKSVPAGRIVSINDLDYGKIISRGDKVSIVVQSGAVRIRASGTALSDAKVGEQVRVKRDGVHNKILQGYAGEDGSVYILSENLVRNE